MTGETGELLERSIKEARRLAQVARRQGAWAGCEGEAESGRQVGGDGGALREGRNSDPSAGRRASRSRTGSCRCTIRTPARSARASSGSGRSLGSSAQLAEVTEHTKTGARGLILPASTELGNPAEETLLPRHGRRARAARDQDPRGCPGRRVQARTDEHRARGPSTRRRCSSLAARNRARSAPQRRLRRYRTGEEGRISHLKRRYGLDRSRLKGDEGRQIWTEWAILAYNTDTLAVRER